jgi:serine/threonine protein kinase
MEHDFLSLMKVLKFSLSEIKSIMKQILSGLDYMHSNNIYHRDLKRRKKYPYFLLANNILYNNRGEVKICDFGMAN